MAYGLIDDKAHSHPKFLNAGLAATGLYFLALSWARSYRPSHGTVPTRMVRQLGGTTALAARLVAAGLWEKQPDGYYIHGYTLLYDRPETRASEAGRRGGRLWQRMRRESPEGRAVLERDGDICRYCGRIVDMLDNIGNVAEGFTFDHVDPLGDNTPDNVVLACRSCNSALARTPAAEKRARLRPPKTQGPYVEPLGGPTEGPSVDPRKVNEASREDSVTITKVNPPSPTDSRPPGGGRGRNRSERIDSEARELADELWPTLDRPIGPRSRVVRSLSAALAARFTADELRAAAPLVDSWTPQGLEYALRVKAGTAAPIDEKATIRAAVADLEARGR